MKRTVCIKLETTIEQSKALAYLQEQSARVCNVIVPIAVEKKCFNSRKLHKECYYSTRAVTGAGSQMVCNALKSVCYAYKALRLKKTDTIPLITFNSKSSIHVAKNTYSFKEGGLSLYTLSGRILVKMVLADYPKEYLKKGKPKEAQLVYTDKTWYFHLVLDLPDVPPLVSSSRGNSHKVLGIDRGENVIVATSEGKLVKGRELRHKRNVALARRRRIQRNDTQSSKRRLRDISGREARHVKHENHVISKAIVKEAVDKGYTMIAMEDLSHIRKNIKGDKSIRIRLHRWPFKQLQRFIEYKAKAVGLVVVYVNPANTSKNCADCGHKGTRSRHLFKCTKCGIRRHADYNASLNIQRIALSIGSATVAVSQPNVAPA